MKRIALAITLLFLLSIPQAMARPACREHPVPKLPTLDEEIVIHDWHVIGPFLSGPREPLANPLESVYHPLDSSGIPNLNARYPSTLEFGGDVGWTPVEADEKGNLDIKFENVDWDKINDEWGASGIYYTGAAYATFQSDKKCRALADAHRIGSFILNGVRYSGDPYGHRLIKPPVILEEGINHILFFFGGFGGEKSVAFKLEQVPSEVMVLERDVLLPDFVRGEKMDGLAAVPVVNTTEKWLENVRVTLYTGSTEDYGSLGVCSYSYTLPPLSVLKMPVECKTQGIFPDNFDQEKVELNILVQYPDGELWVETKARVRDPEDSRIITFKSGIDKSAQKMAVRYPINYDTDRKYALILTTHGAGVKCEGQVDAFQSKDWAFVVAPTNRRRFGFDWQDWGRLDALEVLDYCQENYPIDENRVYLVGHSMGGHGAWHIGSTHADKFAAIVPSAGWASFQLYIPWFLRKDELYADPDLKRILDATQAPDRTELLLPNLRNTPLLAVHGADDDNVPPTHARLLTGMLDRMGYQAALWEEPDQGHWWDASPDVPGADCVDADRIMNFLRNNVRDPYPKHVTFVTYDLGNADSLYWVKVIEPIKPIGKIAVDAEIISGGILQVTTDNVYQLSFDLSGFTPSGSPQLIVIDGEWVDVPKRISEQIGLFRGFDGWELGASYGPDFWKPQFLSTPIKRAYFSPFLIIVGTSGTPDENALNFEIARNLAQRWWYRANGFVQIIRDVDHYTPDESRYNLILIGGPESNIYSFIMSWYMPFKMDKEGVWLGDEFIRGDDLAVKFIFKNPYSTKHILCNWGTSLEGTRLAGSLTCLYSGSGLPDFLIYDKEVKLKGYAGVRAAGFFDNDWELDPDFYYINRGGLSN